MAQKLTAAELKQLASGPHGITMQMLRKAICATWCKASTNLHQQAAKKHQQKLSYIAEMAVTTRAGDERLLTNDIYREIEMKFAPQHQNRQRRLLRDIMFDPDAKSVLMYFQWSLSRKLMIGFN